MRQHPRYGERVKHPRHGDGANCTKKNSSPANPILGDHSTATSNRNDCSPRSTLTVDEVTTIALGMRQLNDSETYRRGYFDGATETERRLAPLRAAEKKELYLDAWWDAMHARISTQDRKTVERALSAAYSPRCYNCGAGRGDTFEGVNRD